MTNCNGTPGRPEPLRVRFVSRALAAALGAAIVAGCASERGVTTSDNIEQAMNEAASPQAENPFEVEPPEPPPEPPAPPERFDLSVADAAAPDFFRGLVEGTDQNIVVHPDVSGTLSLELKQVTLLEVLETVRDVYGYDFRRTNAGFIVMPANLQSRLYEIDYLNLARGGTSRTRVSSGQVSQAETRDSGQLREASGGAVTSGGRNGQERNRTMGSVIDTVNAADFWDSLDDTLRAILGDEQGRQIVVNSQSGVVFARGMPEELRAVGDYLERIHDAAQRQVVLEAKIIEVTLSDEFQAGVNWAAVQVNSDGDTFSGGALSGGPQDNGSSRGGEPIDVGPGNPVSSFASETIGGAFAMAFDVGDFNAFVELLEMQGDTRVLSSPRVATLNNQKAVIKAGSDEFFVTDVSSSTVTGTAATTSRDVTLTPFFSGVALDVTPQISANGEVILHIHPTVSEVTDQTKELTVSGETDELPLAFSEIRESDSVVKAKSGQIIAIGGLMRNTSRRNERTTPVLGRVPGIKKLFGSTRENETKTELVILMRPIVVDDDSDWPRIIRPSADRVRSLSRQRSQ